MTRLREAVARECPGAVQCCARCDGESRTGDGIGTGLRSTASGEPRGQRESLQSVLLLDCAVPASSPLKGSGGLIGPTGWAMVAKALEDETDGMSFSMSRCLGSMAIRSSTV